MDHSEKVKRKPHPRETTNIFSLLTFLYTGKIFAKGFKKDLIDDDLYEVVPNCQSKKCGDKLEQAFIASAKKRKSIFRILWDVYGLRYSCLGALHLTWKLIDIILEPDAISKLVGYFQPGQTKISFYDALYYAGVMIGLKIMHCLYYQNYVIILDMLAIQIRSAFSSIIYRKALKLSPKALNSISLGNIVTVINKDVMQFEGCIWLFNDLWIAVIQTIVICYLIYQKIGWSSSVGVLIVMTTLPIQAMCSKFINSMRTKINKRTDERLQVTQEALSAIRIIKMYTWEKIFEDKIGKTRRKEMSKMLKNAYLKIMLIISSLLVSKLGFYSLIMVYIYVNTEANAQTIFYVMRSFGTLRFAVSMSLSMGFTRIGELVASLTRIEHILYAEELTDTVEKPDDDPQVELRNISVSLNRQPILKEITTKINAGLTVLTGQLGCGKTTMLRVILKDIPIDIGELRTRGRKSYASQDAWLFPSSIRQNILFGETYDDDRYRKVIKVCALEYDFKILEMGDETILVDRGLNLSKGQQARVNLARAVYKDADIYLIDDALTALDPKVQDQIFNECLKGFLKDKLVLMVTHNTKYIENADQVIILENGSIKFDGKKQQLGKDILEAIGDDVVSSEDEEKKKKENEKQEEAAAGAETDALIPPKISKIVRKQVYHENKKEGRVAIGIYKKYVQFGGGFLFFMFIALLYTSATMTESSSMKMLSTWINQQDHLAVYKRNHTLHMNATAMATTTTTMSSLLMNATIPEYNMTLDQNNTNKFSRQTMIEIERLEVQSSKTLNLYSMLIILSTVLELTQHYLILRFAINASVGIHKTMISHIVNSVMSFFDNSFIGNILNRFSQDLSVIDERLPFTFDSMIGICFHLMGLVGLIASVNWRFLLPSIFLIICLVVLRFIYIPTARSLMRLEAATRSPMVGHLNSSIEGLTTIRAYKAQDILKDEFDKHQDLYTSAHFTSIILKRAFAFYMDTFSILFVGFIISRFLFFDTETQSGDVGMTIAQVSGMAHMIQRGLMQWSNLENLMTSVERVMEYTALEPETSSGIEIPYWPSKGEITYVNVSLAYTNSDTKVLKNINFNVKSKQKIGIVGRTGAGKSSIISTLYRLYDYDGQIFIDDVEIKSLTLNFLRSHISIIPQDPIMFAGSIRSNIDPLKEYSDEAVWKTLHKTHLDQVVPNLDTSMDELNFSTGQRQLICLARAIIRKNKIVVLDEATANMDPETEHLIQKTIVENFSACTVFIIAHRLQSILECHKVMVMEKGEIIEFEDPLVLMEDKTSMFAQMLKNAGLQDIQMEQNKKDL